MKAKPQKIITLSEIITALDTLPLSAAREALYESKDAVLFLSATVLKVARRDGLKLHLQVNTEPSSRRMEAHAVFTDEKEIEKVKELKIKKGSHVSISGKFQTCGDSAICLTDCRITENGNLIQSGKPHTRKFAKTASRSISNLLAPAN